MAKRSRPRDPSRAKNIPSGNFENGYCLPPKSGQIKKDEVRNPWGPKGKPKPEAHDPFEFAAAQLTTITLNGEKIEVTAEAAAHLVAFNLAIAGNTRAQKNVQDERRSRRGRTVAVQTRGDIVREHEDEAKRKELSATIVTMLTWHMKMKKQGIFDTEGGATDLSPWAWEAIRAYAATRPVLSTKVPAPSGEQIPTDRA